MNDVCERRRRALGSAASALLMLCAVGCVSSHRGLVQVRSGGPEELRSVHLQTSEGREIKLRSPEDAPVLRALEGTTIEVSGPTLLGSLLVQDWAVVEAGDGSAPYVGILRQHGSNLVIDDRNSGMPLVLDPSSAQRLSAHTGQTVLISGYVVGAQVLHAVNYRILVE
jgi:hypothetical protein